MHFEFESPLHRVKQLILQGENQHLDFKFNISNSRKIAKTLVAFANTQGGRLLIGVKDNGQIAGVRSDEEYYMIEAAATMYTKPEVKFETQEWEVDDRMVLEVYIAESDKKPHYAMDEKGKWLAYIRFEDNNLLANRIWLETIRRKRQEKQTVIKYSEEENLLLAYLLEHKKITLGEFGTLTRISKRKAENILINLAAIGIIEIHITTDETYFTQGHPQTEGQDQIR
ncbi:MAG: ATP-binding protein [Bacteroidia bacterium]